MTKIRTYLMSSDIPYITLLLVATLLAFFPLLFSGAMLSGDERVDGYYQYSIFFSEALENDESYLWNPHSYGGFPTYLNQFGGFLFPPIQFAFRVFPPIFAFHIVIVTAFFLALVCSYHFGRALNLSRPSSSTIGLVYALVQIPGTFHLGLSYVHSFLFLPLILLALVRAYHSVARTQYIFWTTVGVAAVAMALLAGYFVTVVYALIFVGFFTLFLDFSKRESTSIKQFRTSIALTISVLGGVLLSLPHLIPLYAYAPYTSRTPSFGSEMAIGSGLQLLDFVRLVLPYHFQFPLDPGKGYVHFGIVPLFFIGAAIIFVRDRITIFFSAVYAFFLYFALNLPGAEWINVHMPPFSRMGGVSRWLLPAAFAPAVLAAYGIDHAAAFRNSKSFKRFFKLFSFATILFLVLLVLIQTILRSALQSESIRIMIFERVLALKGVTADSLRYPVEHYLTAIERELTILHETFSFANQHFTIFVVLTALGVVALWWYLKTDSLRPRFLILSLVLFGFVAGFFGGLGNVVKEVRYFDQVPAVARAMEESSDFQHYRFIAFPGGLLSTVVDPLRTPESQALLMRELLQREVGTAYNLESVSGFEPIRSVRQNQLIDTALSPLADLVVDHDAIRNGQPIDRYVNSAILKKVTPQEKVNDIIRHIPLLSMMNVKYIVSLYKLSDPRLVPLSFDKIPEITFDYYLYENSAVLPRVYFASQPVVWKSDDASALFLKVLETENFKEKTIIECSSCADYYPPSDGGEITITRYENGLLHAETATKSGSWLVFSESNLPGWVATIDGERTDIMTANYLFQAVYVPEGEHTVEFRYLGSFLLFLEKVGLRSI